MRTPIDERLEQVRTRIPRLTPQAAAAAQATGAVIVDTRDSADRAAEGIIPGSILVTRNTLEWRADPSAEVPHPVLSDLTNHLIIVCNDGYASGLAVESLHQLGHTSAADLIGGYRAWKAAGLPTSEVPDEGGR